MSGLPFAALLGVPVLAIAAVLLRRPRDPDGRCQRCREPIDPGDVECLDCFLERQW